MSKKSHWICGSCLRQFPQRRLSLVIFSVSTWNWDSNSIKLRKKRRRVMRIECRVCSCLGLFGENLISIIVFQCRFNFYLKATLTVNSTTSKSRMWNWKRLLQWCIIRKGFFAPIKAHKTRHARSEQWKIEEGDKESSSGYIGNNKDIDKVLLIQQKRKHIKRKRRKVFHNFITGRKKKQ